MQMWHYMCVCVCVCCEWVRAQQAQMMMMMMGCEWQICTHEPLLLSLLYIYTRIFSIVFLIVTSCFFPSVRAEFCNCKTLNENSMGFCVASRFDSIQIGCMLSWTTIEVFLQHFNDDIIAHITPYFFITSDSNIIAIIIGIIVITFDNQDREARTRTVTLEQKNRLAMSNERKIISYIYTSMSIRTKI